MGYKALRGQRFAMPIRWRPKFKRGCVQKILDAHPLEQSRCEEAAFGVWLVAKTQDDRPLFWVLRPAWDVGPGWMIEEGRIGIIPALPEPPRPKWMYHVCVETDLHCVCALTGADGAASDSYCATQFQDGDAVHAMKFDTSERMFASLPTARRRRS